MVTLGEKCHGSLGKKMFTGCEIHLSCTFTYIYISFLIKFMNYDDILDMIYLYFTFFCYS